MNDDLFLEFVITVFYLFVPPVECKMNFFRDGAQLGKILKIKKFFSVGGAQLDNPLKMSK